MQLKEYLSKIHGDKEKLSALKAAAEAGKDKEFLAAEGVEVSGELSDDALSAVAGGEDNGVPVTASIETAVYKRDSRGNPTHWKETHVVEGTYQIYHYECKKCGRILHEGFFGVYYCDPCDEWYWSPDEKVDQEGRI